MVSFGVGCVVLGGQCWYWVVGVGWSVLGGRCWYLVVSFGVGCVVFVLGG